MVSESFFPLAILVATFVFAILLLKIIRSANEPTGILPPGPKQLPLIGNVHQVGLPLLHGYYRLTPSLRSLLKKTGLHLVLGLSNMVRVASNYNVQRLLINISRTGDMFYLSIFGKPLIVVNSMQIASDLLDKRSANYSERPTFEMAGEM